MPTGEGKGRERQTSVRSQPHAIRISGMSLPIKFTLVSASTFAILMLIFAWFIYGRTANLLEKEIDRYGAGLVNTLASSDLSNWELSDRSWISVRNWLEAHWKEYGTFLSETYYLDYVRKEDQANAAPRPDTVPKKIKEKFLKQARRIRNANEQRIDRLTSFRKSASDSDFLQPGDILNIFINRVDSAGKETGSVARVQDGNFQALFAETNYTVQVDGQEVRTEVRIQEGQDSASRERARLYWCPVRDDDGTVTGRAYVVLSEAKIEAKLGSLAVIIAILTIGFIALGAAASFFVSSRMIQPLKLLVEDIEIVASGELDHRTRAITNDEVGMVARTFDRMTRSMEEAERERTKHQAIEHDVNLVREIHGKLLPSSLPRLAGFDTDFFSQPSEEIGADYYDVIEVDQDHTMIVMAGLPRKGVASAMLMALTRTLIRTESQTGGKTPAEILKRVNRTLAEDIRKGMYVTVMLTLLEPASRKLTVANAGHVPMLVHRSSSESIESIGPDGIALGLDAGPMFDASLKEEQHTLAPGDRVVLYTNGMLQTKNRVGEPFGEKRFQALVKKSSAKNSAAFVNIVGSYLEKYREGSSDSEDLTLLTFKVRG